jgi:ferritin-like metal-binding protein YciE
MAGGALKSWATKLGMNEAAELLDQALAEEKKTMKHSARSQPPSMRKPLEEIAGCVDRCSRP